MKILNPPFVNIIRQYLVFVLVIFSCNMTVAQTNIYTQTSTFTHDLISNNNNSNGIKIIDSEITAPNHININPKASIKLIADSDNGVFQWTKTRIEFNVIPYKSNGDLDIDNSSIETLEVEYNPIGNSANFIDLSSIQIANCYGVKVEVVSVLTTNMQANPVTTSTTINPNIKLELTFETERYYLLSNELAFVNPTFLLDTDNSPAALKLEWQNIKGAVEYELEWTWIDNYSDANIPSNSTTIPTLGADLINLTERDFELNNTRVRVNNTNYEIPLIYSKGYIIYRVRALGKKLDDITITHYGLWSSGTAIKEKVVDWADSYIEVTQEHENKKNWQFQASYAEDGKKKEVVSYFDGSLRNRQTVTKVNTDNNAVVGEVIYDTQGRAAIEVLPVPLYNKKYIRYFANLNKNAAGTAPFTHLDFDWETGVEDVCNSTSLGMNTSSGASNYYSSQSAFLAGNSPFVTNVPDAYTFPYSQTEYTPDNTGRIVRKGGVGPRHKLGSGQEMEYIYTVPKPEELNRLFGYQVGNANRYKKNIVKDPNKQVSVSYIDPQGRTIATALTPLTPLDGETETKLELLDDANNADLHQTITTDLLNKLGVEDFNTTDDKNELESTNNFLNWDDKLVLSEQLGVASTSTHNFSYKIKNNEFYTPTQCIENYAFVYDLNLSLKDKCGKELFASNLQNQLVGAEGFTPSTASPTTINGTPISSEIGLTTGSYALSKELKVNKKALENYVNHYMSKLTDENDPCYINPNAYQQNIVINCETTCLECTQSIGTEIEYIENQLNGIFNVPSTYTNHVFNLTLNIEDAYEVIISMPADDEIGAVINFGQSIDEDKVEELAVKLRAEWENLNKICEQLCGVTFSSSCDIDETTLLKDVSPNGQYCQTSDQVLIPSSVPIVEGEQPISNFSLSLLNDANNIVYQGKTNDLLATPPQINTWRNPVSPYLDNDGTESRIEVTLVNSNPMTYSPAIVANVTVVIDPETQKKYVKPQELANVNDFIYYWNANTWAKSLLPYHPEYCYLEYSKALCGLTKQYTISQYNNNSIPIPDTAQTKNITSDEYDAYLDYLDTYEKANHAGLFSFNNITNGLYNFVNSDPYFKLLPQEFENTTLFDSRKAIMMEALTNHYENYTKNSDGDGGSANMFQAAVMIATCNSVDVCNFDDIILNYLTDIQKDDVWNTYKSLYKSLKSRIKHVFINTYAVSKGCYNGCIGNLTSSEITGVIKNYIAKNSIDAYIASHNPTNSATAVFCNVAGDTYRNSEKRFVPVDVFYDSSINEQEAIDQMQAASNYQYYQETGKCPSIVDLDLYLKDFFTRYNLTTLASSNNPFSSPIGIGRAMSKKMFKDLTGNDTPIVGTPSSVSTTFSDKQINFNFTPTTFSATTAPLTLRLPSTGEGSALTWSNYKVFNKASSNWHIAALKEIYYNKEASTLTGTNVRFAYKIVAKVVVLVDNVEKIKEIVLSGTTLVKIGECYPDGQNPPGLGDSLVLETEDCNKKDTFAQELKKLIKELKLVGNAAINNTNPNGYAFPTDNLTVVRQPFFSTFFLVEQLDTQVKWKYINTNTNYHIYEFYVKDERRFTLQYPKVENNDLGSTNIITLDITGRTTIPNQGQAAHYVDLVLQTTSGNKTFKGYVFTKATDRPMYFACCAPCGEWDYNFNGIGDGCEHDFTENVSGLGCNESACETKQKFENGLKDLLNDLNQAGLINSQYLDESLLMPFIENNYLYEYIGGLNFGNENINVVWTKNNNIYQLKFGTYSQGSAYITISFSDKLGPNGIQSDHYFNSIEVQPRPIGSNALGNKVTIDVSSITSPVNEGSIYIGMENYSINNLSNNFQRVYLKCCCGPHDWNWDGVGDGCETTCQLNNEASVQQNYADDLMLVLNEVAAYKNATPTHSIKNMDHYCYTDSAISSAVQDYINNNNLESHFNALREKVAPDFDPVNSPLANFSYRLFPNETKALMLLWGEEGQYPNEPHNIAGIAMVDFNFNDVGHITNIEFTGEINMNGDYLNITYKNLASQTVTDKVLFCHQSGYSDILISGLKRSGRFCNFMNEDYVNSQVLGKFENLDTNSLIKDDNEANKVSIYDIPKCGCIPETVDPKGCSDAFEAYQEVLALNTNIQGLKIYTEEEFCTYKLQYLYQDYFYYLNELLITDSLNPNYLTMVQFGNTNLNIGYKSFHLAVEKYIEYNNKNGENENRYYWNDFINLDFIVNSLIGCPPKPMEPAETEFTLSSPCEGIAANVSATYKLDSYNEYLNSLRKKFIKDYIEKAMSTAVENFTMSYADKEYQYTLYYYDQAGNLVKTVAPEGVKRFEKVEMETKNAQINAYRKTQATSNVENADLIPNHSFRTEYKYNTLNQLVYQETPDGGKTRFAYDELGRIIASQNDKQKAYPSPDGNNKFSYTKYDELGRIVEAGEVITKQGFSINDSGRLLYLTDPINGFEDGVIEKREVTRTVYTEDPEVPDSPSGYASGYFAKPESEFSTSYNNRNRVTGIFYYDQYDGERPDRFNNAIFYNYDIHGNVKEQVTYNTYLRDLSCNPQVTINSATNQTNDCEKHIKRVVYDYDLISGNVNNVTFQPNKIDQFIHKYNYDADNRIVDVQTSKDGVIWETDANYKYYPHGPLARTEIGDKKVQGIDYAYTLQGWLKTVNGENIMHPNNDIGKDGDGKTVKDAYGYSLSYYDKQTGQPGQEYADYKAIGGDAGDATYKPLMFSRDNGIPGNNNDLFNGNIKQMTTAVRKNQDELLTVQKNNYRYDQLNRIKSMTSSAITPSTSGYNGYITSYNSRYSYDKNGNLMSLYRAGVDANGAPYDMDRLNYDYVVTPNGRTNNKLALVHDAVQTPNNSNDLEDQVTQLLNEVGIAYDVNNEAKHNYIYDQIGQLIEDRTEGLVIDWRVDGKVKSVTKTGGTSSEQINFEYDGLGNRIAKSTYSLGVANPVITSQYYARDAQGNVLAVYDLVHQTATSISNMYLKEHHIYGSSRIGLEDEYTKVYTSVTPGGGGIEQRKINTATLQKKAIAQPIDIAADTNLVTNTNVDYPIVPNYALNFGSSTITTWPLSSSSPSIPLQGDLSNFSFATKLKLTNTSLVNNTYSLGKFEYSATTNEDIFINLAYPSLPTVSCMTISQASDGVSTNIVRRPVGDSGCMSSLFNGVERSLGPKQEGYIEYDILPLSSNNGVQISFLLGGSNYIGLYATQDSNNIFRITLKSFDNSYISQISVLNNYEPLKLRLFRTIQGDNSVFTFSLNGSNVLGSYTYPALGQLMLRVNMAGVNNSIQNAKLVLTGTKLVSNQILVNIKKNDNTFKPNIILNQFIRSSLATNPDLYIKRTYAFEGSNSLFISNNEVDLNVSGIKQNNLWKGNVIGANGTNEHFNATESGASNNAYSSVPIYPFGQNKIGSNSSGAATLQGFKMCDFNYTIDAITDVFTFDNVTTPGSSTVNTTLQPVSVFNGIPMTQVTPTTFSRTLGICNIDQDHDGIYDINENNIGNDNNNLGDDDTDHDGIPNFLDPDDDGDGIATQTEVSNADGDYNPLTPAPLNTDGDSLPNYLDADDDGDGYPTWETIEGGPGAPNHTPLSYTGYTSDTDNDGIYQYLDKDFTYPDTSDALTWTKYFKLVGDKRYELVNHLGNVLVVVSDKKIPYNPSGLNFNHFNADVLAYNDYYPFGQLVPNRHGSTNTYRYGFNGKEKDDEIKGEGNSLDFGERLLDTRVGRWWSTDNVEKPWLSPYQFADNNPVNNVDADGNDEIHFYYKTQQMLDKDGKAYTQLSLSSEIIKNNSEHTFFMHSPQGATVEFHPFKSDRTPNETSTEAYENRLPLSKGVSWFFGLGEKGVDDHAYLGTLLQAAPEVMEHYSDVRQDGMRFKGAVNRASSVDFAETVIRAEETLYAIVDGYYLVKGLSKFAVKELAKNSVKLAETNVKSVVQSTSRVTFNPKALYAKYAERHIFSAKHLKNGILDLGTKKEILHKVTKTINEKMSLLKEGENYIYTKINGKSATISASVENGAVRSVNVVKGEQIARDATKVNVIK